MMMKVTQRHEIPKLRLAALCPMLDVMTLGVTRVRAPRKAAASVPGLQRPLNRKRNRPRLAADVQRVTVIVLDRADERSVAGQTRSRNRCVAAVISRQSRVIRSSRGGMIDSLNYQILIQKNMRQGPVNPWIN